MLRPLFAAMLLLLLAACSSPDGLELRLSNEWRRPVVVAVHEGRGRPPAELWIAGQQVVAPRSQETFRMPPPAGEWTLSVDGDPVAEYGAASPRVLSVRVAADRSVTVGEVAPDG